MKIKDIKNKMLITVVVFLYALFLYMTKLPCIFIVLTGFECPGCGMTSALKAAVHMDFYGAFSKHLMFWSVPLLYICFLRDGRLFDTAWKNVAFYVIIAIGFLINWAI